MRRVTGFRCSAHRRESRTATTKGRLLARDGPVWVTAFRFPRYWQQELRLTSQVLVRTIRPENVAAKQSVPVKSASIRVACA